VSTVIHDVELPKDFKKSDLLALLVQAIQDCNNEEYIIFWLAGIQLEFDFREHMISVVVLVTINQASTKRKGKQ